MKPLSALSQLSLMVSSTSKSDTFRAGGNALYQSAKSANPACARTQLSNALDLYKCALNAAVTLAETTSAAKNAGVCMYALLELQYGDPDQACGITDSRTARLLADSASRRRVSSSQWRSRRA